MTDGLLKLMAWLSPGYPVGAYTYSHGLEWAVQDGRVTDAASSAAWIDDCLRYGGGRSDAILLAHAWRAADDEVALADLAEFAEALAPTAERLTETADQGRAFAQVTAAAWGDADGHPTPYPVALGSAAARAGLALDTLLPLFLQAWAANLVSAAVRLVPLGQTDGQKIIAGLSPVITEVADQAESSPLDAIGGCAILSDIASMRHETQETRLFRS